MAGNYSKIKSVVTGETITASDRNSEHDNHIANMTPASGDDYSTNLTEMRLDNDPYPADVASQATTLAGEIERLRYQIRQITGKTYWYQDPPFNFTNWVDASKYATIKAAVDDIGSTQKTLVISTSINASNAADAVVTPSTLSIYPISPGVIAKGSATSLTINGPVVGNPMHQWLSGFAAGEVAFGRISEIWSEWWGASPLGIIDSTTAIQCAIDAAGGTEWTYPPAGGVGPHTKLRFQGGVYKTTTKLSILAGSWLDISGASMKGTYIYHQGTGDACLQVVGAFYLNHSAVRKSSEFADGIIIHDISLGSNSGHALSLLNAYRPAMRRVSLFSAGVASNYLDIDGCSLVRGDDIQVGGNDVYPSWNVPGGILYGFTQGIYGVEVTARVDGNGRYNISGEIYLKDLWVQAQQTQDAVYVHIDSGADFQIYPIIIDGGDLIVHGDVSTYSAVKVDRGIVILNDIYVEKASTGTIDAINIVSSQGNSTVYANNIIAETGRLNFTGDVTYPSTLVVKGGSYSAFVYTGNSYAYLDIQDAKIGGVRVSNAAATRIWQPVEVNSNNMTLQVPSGTATSASHKFLGSSDYETNTEYLLIGTNLLSSEESAMVSGASGSGTAHPIKAYIGVDKVLDLSVPTVDQNAGLIIRVKDGGTVEVRQVSMGVDDSGGAGYKLLRVAN